MIKDSDKQPDEDTHGEIQQGPVQELQAPWSWDEPPSQHTYQQVCSSTQKLSQLHTFRIFMEDSPHRHDQVVPPSPPPLLLQEDGAGQRNAAEKFQASNHSLVFLLTSPHPEAIWGLPTVTSLGQKTLLSPRKSQEM